MKIACTSYNGIDYPRECDQYLDDKSDSDSKPFPIWAIILIVIAVFVRRVFFHVYQLNLK